MCKLIHHFLIGRSFRVKIDNILSDSFGVGAGVPQGLVLGPILYNLYVSDIPIENNENNEVKSLLFADDIVLYMASQNIERATDETSNTLHNLNIYFQKWKIKINAQKCESIVFRPSGKLNSHFK